MWHTLQLVPNWALPWTASPGNALPDDELLDDELLDDELLDELLLEELLGVTTTPDEELLEAALLLDELLLDELLEEELLDDELDDDELDTAVPPLELLDEDAAGGESVSGGASGGELLQAINSEVKTHTAISFALSHITASHPWHLCRAAYSEFLSDLT